MEKTRLVVRFAPVFCLLLALFLVVLLGIPFWNVPALFEEGAMNLSGDFSNRYAITFSAENQDYDILVARTAALPYEGVTITKTTNGECTLTLPRSLSSGADAIAKTISATGKITYTDDSGVELFPSDAVRGASVGFGQINPNSTKGAYYLEFYLNEEYRTAFGDATEELSTRKSEGKNILHVKLDGSDILQATVTERMTNDSFLIGGSFSDTTLPNLYAAFVNGGTLSENVEYSSPEAIEPSLSYHAYVLFWCSLLFLVLIKSIFDLLRFGTPAVYTFVFSLLFLGVFAVFYQASGMTISPLSFVGILICILLLNVVLEFSYRKLKNHILLGRNAESALRENCRVSMPFFFIFSFALVVVFAILLALGSSTPAMRDLSLPCLVGAISLALLSAPLNSYLFKTLALTKCDFAKRIQKTK